MDITKGVPNRLTSVGTPYLYYIHAYARTPYLNTSIFPYFHISIFQYFHISIFYMFAMHMMLAKTPAAVTLAPAP